eukprot:4798317-Karenia_brevis.AAC.1
MLRMKKTKDLLNERIRLLKLRKENTTHTLDEGRPVQWLGKISHKWHAVIKLHSVGQRMHDRNK